MKTFKIFSLLVITLCITMYALADISTLFLLPVSWLFLFLDWMWVDAIVGWESFWTFPTLFGFSMIILGCIISLFILFFIARHLSKKSIKDKK